ncbi:MAG: iron-containing alcohol dehydrogenase [Muribaculaceae bacterium]|nr:iron-containing alcohol dehydrogenase [Muribaculaceae bacterium]
MNSFQFQNPVKIIFGEGKIASISRLLAPGTKVMMTYGGCSIKSNGIYKQVTYALSQCTVIEFGGIEANPDYDTLMRAISLGKSEKIDFILAVGGGSIIDGTKFIAAGINYDGAPWEFVAGKAKEPAALPFGTVLTLPATGSEMNCGAVISRRATQEKYPFNNPEGFPQFSVLDPTAVYSLPQRQVANGIIDTFIHTTEQYLTTAGSPKVMDRFAEGALRTLIDIAPRILAEGDRKYADCADFMMAATMGLNGFLAMGVDEDWATHMIGHELTALHGLDHGVTLAIVWEGTMHVMRREKEAKLLQYAREVWGISCGETDEIIDKAIASTENFFRSLGVKTRLGEYGIGEDTIRTIRSRFEARNWNLGENGIVTPQKVEEILRSRL